MTTTFPIPQTIPFVQLGLPYAAAQLFSPSLFGPKYGGNVNSVLAFRLAKKMRFGAACRSSLWKRTWGTIESRFFPGVEFHRSKGEILPIEVGLKERAFADGDTARVARFLSGSGWVEFPINVRMDGIDTPESNPSGKLTRFVDCISRYLKIRFDLPDTDDEALWYLVKARIVYLGKIAGVVTGGFADWARASDLGFRLAPAYSRVAEVPELCDTLDLADKYGRFIGRVMAGRANEGEDLLAGFVEAALPAYMARVGEFYHVNYREKLLPYAGVLKRWKVQKPELYRMLSFENAPRPREVFSRGEGERLAGLWRGFVAGHDGVANDVQTVMAMIGVGLPYPKYRGHRTAIDLEAERYALGAVPGLAGKHGLADDAVYMFMRPSADPQDPYYSPVFAMFEEELSDGKPLNPPDCCDVFRIPPHG